jgi:hypothetical protein
MRLIFQRDEKERIAESLMTQGNTGLELLQGPVHTKTAMILIGTCKNRSSDSIDEE